MTEETDSMIRARIQKYVSGNMSPEEEHLFEKEMLDDPFLADAVDGFMQSPSHQDSEKLKQLDISLRQEHNSTRKYYWRWAAFFIGLISAGLVIWTRIQSPVPEIQSISQSGMNMDSIHTPLQNETAPTLTENLAPEKQKNTQSEYITSAPPAEKFIAQVETKQIQEDMPQNSAGAEYNIQSGQIPVIASDPQEQESEDISLLYNPDIAEQLLSWAGSFPEPELSTEISATQKETKTRIQKTDAAPKASEQEIRPEKKQKSIPAPSRGMIIKMIREGRFELAEQEINRMDVKYQSPPVAHILRSALALKQGKKMQAQKALEPLKQTSHGELAEKFRAKIKE